MKPIQSKADLRRENAQLRAEIAKREEARAAQEELIERLMRELAETRGIELQS